MIIQRAGAQTTEAAENAKYENGEIVEAYSGTSWVRGKISGTMVDSSGMRYVFIADGQDGIQGYYPNAIRTYHQFAVGQTVRWFTVTGEMKTGQVAAVDPSGSPRVIPSGSTDEQLLDRRVTDFAFQKGAIKRPQTRLAPGNPGGPQRRPMGPHSAMNPRTNVTRYRPGEEIRYKWGGKEYTGRVTSDTGGPLVRIHDYSTNAPFSVTRTDIITQQGEQSDPPPDANRSTAPGTSASPVGSSAAGAGSSQLTQEPVDVALYVKGQKVEYRWSRVTQQGVIADDDDGGEWVRVQGDNRKVIDTIRRTDVITKPNTGPTRRIRPFQSTLQYRPGQPVRVLSSGSSPGGFRDGVIVSDTAAQTVEVTWSGGVNAVVRRQDIITPLAPRASQFAGLVRLTLSSSRQPKPFEGQAPSHPFWGSSAVSLSNDAANLILLSMPNASWPAASVVDKLQPTLDGKAMMVGGSNKHSAYVQRVELSDGAAADPIRLPAAGAVVDFSPSGKRAMTLHAGALCVWDIDALPRRASVIDITSTDTLSSDPGSDNFWFVTENLAVITQAGKWASLVDLNTGLSTWTIRLLPSDTLAITPDRKRLAIAGKARDQIAIVDTATGNTVVRLDDSGGVTDMSFNSDAHQLLTLTKGYLTVWSVGNKSRLKRIAIQQGQKGPLWPIGSDYVLLGYDKLLDLRSGDINWEFKDGAQILYADKERLWAVIQSPSGMWVLANTPALTPAIRNLASRPQQIILKPGDSVRVDLTGLPASIDPESRANFRQALVARVQEAGIKVDDHAPLAFGVKVDVVEYNDELAKDSGYRYLVNQSVFLSRPNGPIPIWLDESTVIPEDARDPAGRSGSVDPATLVVLLDSFLAKLVLPGTVPSWSVSGQTDGAPAFELPTR